MICRVCSQISEKPIFAYKIFDKKVNYFDCINCGYAQTETPTWLEKAYESTMNLTDTGIMKRNYENVYSVISTLMTLNKLNGTVVDYSGGYGILVRLLRDIGIEAFWTDPFAENLVAKGFEFKFNQTAELVTAFEAFEHFIEPVKEMQQIFRISPNLLLTTSLIGNPAPKPQDWWYYGLDHGQHIGFFRIKTLNWLGEKFDKKLISNGRDLHLFTEKSISKSKWKIILKINQNAPWLFSRQFKSKTWDDHLYLKGKQINTE